MTVSKVTKKALKDVDEDDDLFYWRSQSFEAKLEAMAAIRHQYFKLRGELDENGRTPGFLRVLRVLK